MAYIIHYFMISRNTMKASLRSAMTALTLAVVGVSVLAQTAARPDRGMSAVGSYSVTDIESVSLTNGNLNLSIPLAALPPMAGGKLGWTVRANYNSKIWDEVKEERRPDDPINHPNYVISKLQLADLQAGWALGAAYSLDFIDSHSDYDWLPLTDGTDPEYALSQLAWKKTMLTMPDGSQHELRPWTTTTTAVLPATAACETSWWGTTRTLLTP